jgi:Protein tyrosine and serine/threonine kinase/Leucine rich repeat
MNTMRELRSGTLCGAKEVRISEGLEEFPRELFELSDTLEVLDLSGNRLCTLPSDFGRLKALRIVFFSDNLFTSLPRELAQCPQLSMVGFKANRIEEFPEDALPASVRWLILTDNRLTRLPASIARLEKLQKLMLAGNHLDSLPPEMSRLHRLELLRISANRLTCLPEWLLELPRLSWLAYAGNPFCQKRSRSEDACPELTWTELVLGNRLGSGASGDIFQARWLEKDTQVAVKIFKGEVTSDGYPQDESLACLQTGQHPSIVGVLATTTTPEGGQALVLSLIPPDFKNLGHPPSRASCTRDVYPEGTTFPEAHALHIARGVASACAHLHSRGLLHGDLYACSATSVQPVRWMRSRPSMHGNWCAWRSAPSDACWMTS